MIKQIHENFPEVNDKPAATLSSATVTLQDMAERTIASTVKLDGQSPTDFSKDWELEHDGERYIMPLRRPQAAKGNESINATADLTFYHWAEYQLKRYYFFTVQSVATDEYIPDKYIASVSLSLSDFKDLFNKVLHYYFGDKISMRIAKEWESKTDPDPVNIEISYSYLWDVLIQFYELFAVRWKIIREGDNYVIVVGQSEPEISHIFQYGYEGGLLKVERQIQDENIRNILYGRGGEKNIPYRYFKRQDPDNPSFAADPDAIPELENVFFSELRSKEFRDYVQGWKCNRNRKLAYSDGEGVFMVKPDTKRTDWAYLKALADTKFDPPEYVKDDASIDRYGELVGSLENNEDIYPSIQGRYIDGLGRIDEAVDVEQVEDVSMVNNAEKQAMTADVPGGQDTINVKVSNLPANKQISVTVTPENGAFQVPEGYTGDFDVTGVSGRVMRKHSGAFISLEESTQWEIVGDYTINVYNIKGEVVPASGLPAGSYTYSVTATFVIKVNDDYNLSITTQVSGGKLTNSLNSDPERDGRTFRVWVKNIWQTSKLATESNSAYVDRVWNPILGDREKQEAKLVFASGQLSISEDYEFTIHKIEYDPSHNIRIGTNDIGQPILATSEWCLTLIKSEADYESTGMLVPSMQRQGQAGDFFFFTGIDMPHLYVTLAEKALSDYKLEELAKVADISPTWQVQVDRVRANEVVDGKPLRDWLVPGAPLRLTNLTTPLFDIDGAYETLYIQSVTLKYREPSNSDAALNPDIELILSNNYETTASPVAQLQGSVNALSRRLGSLGNIEQLIRAVGDKLYLRKDGIADLSVSPTSFANLLTSYGFREGMIGGQGWGFYRDANGNWVLETDRLKARQDFEVNTLIVSQIEARGGMIVESAASLEITAVQEVDNGYKCFFDQKDGSIKNLFKVDDVALCHRFNPATTTSPTVADSTESEGYEKFYKRRVVEVGNDYVLLTNRMIDTNGSGSPSAGDVIVQFGSYSNANRRFVIIRDVVGGGYERFLENLVSVDSPGQEYFFVGKQSSTGARFFLGNDSNFIEYLNGKLRIKAELSVESTIGDKSFDAYFEELAGDVFDNYALLTSTPAEVVIPKDQDTSSVQYVWLYDVVGVKGRSISFSCDCELLGNGTAVGGSKVLAFALLERSNYVVGTSTLHSINLNTFAPGQYHIEVPHRKVSDLADDVIKVGFVVRGYNDFTIRIKNVMISESGHLPAWRPSSSDRDTLYRALLGNTTISGGLVLSSVIETGEQSGDTFIVRSGISGLIDTAHSHGGPVFWGGGTYQQASDGKSTYVIYMDGTGHASGGVVQFKEDRLKIGDIMSLSRDGLEMSINNSAEPQMAVGNYDISQYTRALDHSLLFVAPTYQGATYNGQTLFSTKDDGEGGYALTLYCDDASSASSFYFPSAGSLNIQIGPVLAGATITLVDSQYSSVGNFSLGTAGSVLPSFRDNPSLQPWLKIEIVDNYNNNNVLNTQTIRPKYDNGYPYWSLSSFSWTASKYHGYLSVRLSLINNTHIGCNISRQCIVIYSPYNLRAKLTNPQLNRTLLGQNGAMLSWGTSNQYQTNGLWGIRVGEYGIKVCADGIYILRPGHTVWEKLNPDKMI